MIHKSPPSMLILSNMCCNLDHLGWMGRGWRVYTFGDIHLAFLAMIALTPEGANPLLRCIQLPGIPIPVLHLGLQKLLLGGSMDSGIQEVRIYPGFHLLSGLCEPHPKESMMMYQCQLRHYVYKSRYLSISLSPMLSHSSKCLQVPLRKDLRGSS